MRRRRSCAGVLGSEGAGGTSLARAAHRPARRPAGSLTFGLPRPCSGVSPAGGSTGRQTSSSKMFWPCDTVPHPRSHPCPRIWFHDPDDRLPGARARSWHGISIYGDRVSAPTFRAMGFMLRGRAATGSGDQDSGLTQAGSPRIEGAAGHGFQNRQDVGAAEIQPPEGGSLGDQTR